MKQIFAFFIAVMTVSAGMAAVAADQANVVQGVMRTGNASLPVALSLTLLGGGLLFIALSRLKNK